MNKLHIIHPSSRRDRYDLLIPQLKEQGIEYQLWDNPIGQSMPERRMLINSGHKKIVRYAKERKFPRITIAENDITFTGKGAWDYYLSQIPESYDMFLGMIYSKDVEAIVNNRLMKEVSGFTLYTIHERFYDTFLSTPDDKHIDREVTKMSDRYEFLLPEYFVCYQNDTQSDNTMGKPDLPSFLKGRKLFNKD